jgi:GWxTD domain-containing protein
MKPSSIIAAFAVVAIAVGGVRADSGHAPKDPAIRFALERLADGDTPGAIKALAKADLERTHNPRWFVLLGRLYREQGTITSRLQSQQVLERAVQLFPDDSGVMLELGLTYYAQTFYPDAVRYFERCLAASPDECRAMYKLGVIHYERWKLRVNSYMDEAEEAAEWLGRTIECDTTNLDAAERYVNALYGIGRGEDAARAARRLAVRFPESTEFPLMVGTLAYEDGRLAAADSAYDAALERMNEEERTAYASLDRNVLGYRDLDAFEKATAQEKPVMERAFWITADPDPTTDINEGRLEHFYRTFRSDVFFSHAKAGVSWTQPQVRGWETERGETSIKLGWPAGIYASHGGDRLEVWSYADGEDVFTVPFLDPLGSGNLTVPPIRGNFLGMIRDLNRVSTAKSPSVFVDGAIDAVAFMDDQFRCTVYICMHADADSLLRNADVSSLRNFRVRTRFFDKGWIPEETDTLLIPAHKIAMIPGSRFRIYDVVLDRTVPFDNYHVACTLEDDAGGAKAALRCVCEASHLSRSGLTSSELLFLRDGPPGASFVRGGELLMPNPWRSYGNGQRVGVYFEVYNLSVAARASRYRVTYEIYEDREKSRTGWDRLGRFIANFVGMDQGAPMLAQTFDRTGDSHRSSERMAVDVDLLPEGRYRLWVEIEDLISGAHWETSRNFFKVGSPEVAQDETHRR